LAEGGALMRAEGKRRVRMGKTKEIREQEKEAKRQR
jgi:hypothetical protein